MNLMKKQINLLESILRKLISRLFIISLLLFVITAKSHAKENWKIDKKISQITFEVPVLFATNVKGEFTKIDGFVELDLENKKNNKAIISVAINSLDINYKKYTNLLLSPIFLDMVSFPIAVIDTKKFYYDDENELKLNIELSIKGKSKIVETDLKINRLSTDIVEILGRLEFSRNDFDIGTGKWKNTSILKDNIIIHSKIFLFKD